MCIPGDTIKNKGLTTPPDIRRFDDIQYGPDKKWNVLDVYRPKDAEGDLPVLIDVHGGGWVYGDKERYQYYCMSLAQQGFVVVNFTYGLAPKRTFPAGMVDTDNVVKFVFANAKKYGFDTSKIFFAGDSAGANMAAIYAAICTNPEYAKNFPFTPPKGFVPKAMLLNCGVYDLEQMMKSPIGKMIHFIITRLICVAGLIMFLPCSFELMDKMGGTLSAALRIPMRYIYLAFPIGAVLMLLAFIKMIPEKAKAIKEGRDE